VARLSCDMNPWTVRIDYGRANFAIGLPLHPDQHRPKRPVLHAVDQEFREGAALRVAPELADTGRPGRSPAAWSSAR
jgi:hypothetical protein